MSSSFPVRPRQMALVIVDMQRYFTQPDHPFGRLSSSRVEGGIAGYFARLDTAVIPHIQWLLRAFRQRACPIFYTQLGSHNPAGEDLPAWARRINQSGRQALGALVFPPFTERSAEIDPRIAPETDARILRKTTTGAVASSPLETDLRELGVTSVVVAGVLTPFCVTQTARELADRNFDVAIVEDASASLTVAAHSAALAAFAAIYGWVLATRELIDALDRQPG